MKSNKKDENARAHADRAAQTPADTQIAVDSLGIIRKATSHRRRSKPIETSDTTAGYIRMLASEKINKQFCLNFEHVTHKTFTEFKRDPIKFLTLRDMALVQAFTGVEVQRQIDLLTNGSLQNEQTSADKRPHPTMNEALKK